jgi:hypothetical protein
MNGKKAKILRKQAQNISEGLPLKSYKTIDGTIVLDKCTRKYYKILKQEYKNNFK